jgi:nitric oxide reductase NorD protein
MEHSPPLSHEPSRSAALSRRPRVRAAEDDEDDPSPGVWMIQTTEPQPHAEDPFGLNRPEDREADEDAEGSTDSLAELDQARLIHTPSSSRECFFSSDPPPRREEDRTVTAASAGIAYPEWDYQTDSYRERAVRVFQVSAPDGPEDWSEAVLARHAGTLHDIRRRLATIRPDRRLIKNQTEGDDIDWDALVAERSERRAGIAPSGAFYQSRRPAPRRLGLVLLIDASASTDAWVGGHVRVIDVEKEAALLAAAALDETGIDFAAMAFSGEGPQSVQARWIKEFASPWDIGCRRRIAGLEPERYTRLGAALRHAAAILAACPVEHRLLLIFSDGRPNDCDRYASRYGIEDARQAVVEAQLQHILPYCFTVDREGGSYLPAIFGPSHYAVVQHPQQLPETFINWIQKAARHCR